MAAQLDDTVVRGSFRITEGNVVTLPTGSVAGAAIAGGVAAEKVTQLYDRIYSQDDTAASQTIGCRRARGAGVVDDLRVWFSEDVNAGAATVTVDLKKNGTTMLTAVIETDASDPTAINTDVEASFSGTPSYVSGDHFTIEIVATAGGGTLGKGLCVQPVFKEEYAG
ncbi:MAG: hypothetical protein IT419_04860 [Planctomycetes bacterium]|nr:hypothetical protein [Planctomycetota bacterium]